MNKKYNTTGVVMLIICLLSMMASRCFADAGLPEALQDYITKALGKGWVASPYGADQRYRPKTMFIYLNDLQERYEGKATEKGWIPFSSGLGIYPEEYVPVQTEAVTLFDGSTDALTKLSFFASVQKVLASIGLKASVKAELEKNWNVKVEIEEAQKEWVWQDEMRLAQEITSKNAERLVEVIKTRYKGKVPPMFVVIASLRVKGLTVIVENKTTTSAELNVELTEYLAKMGLSWNQEKKRYESLKIKDWQYVAFQGQRAPEGQCTIGSNKSELVNASEIYVPPTIYAP